MTDSFSKDLEAFDNNSKKNKPKKETQTNLEIDYEYTRQKIKSILDSSAEVLETAADVAIESGDPRAIEVYANIAKSMTEMAKSVMDNNKILANIERDKTEIKRESTGNSNTVFIGSANDLMKMLNDGAKDAIDITPEKE